MQAISLLINFTVNSSVTVEGLVTQWSQSGGPGFEPHSWHLWKLLDPSLYSPERTSAATFVNGNCVCVCGFFFFFLMICFNLIRRYFNGEPVKWLGKKSAL